MRKLLLHKAIMVRPKYVTSSNGDFVYVYKIPFITTEEYFGDAEKFMQAARKALCRYFHTKLPNHITEVEMNYLDWNSVTATITHRFRRWLPQGD